MIYPMNEIVYGIDETSEKLFNDWLDSIEFVDEEGKIIIYDELPEDITTDPEGDRE